MPASIARLPGRRSCAGVGLTCRGEISSAHRGLSPRPASWAAKICAPRRRRSVGWGKGVRESAMRSIRSLLLVSFLALGVLGMGPCASEFDLGVGAFEVGQTRAILWTHTVPEDPERRSVTVRLEVATDENFAQLVRSQATMPSSL